MTARPSPDHVLIRPATEDDLTAYRDLRLEALRNHPEAFGADYEQSAASPITFWEERLRLTINNPRAIMFFAVANDALIGTIGISRMNVLKQQHTATIWGVYVQPAWRGQHIAETLMTACIDWAQTQQILPGQIVRGDDEHQRDPVLCPLWIQRVRR